MDSYESFLNNLTDNIENVFYIQIKDRCLVGVYDDSSGDLVCSATMNDEVYVEYVTKLITDSHEGLHPEDALYVFIQLFLAYCHWKVEGSRLKEKDEFAFENMDGFWESLGKPVIKRVKFGRQIDWRFYPAKFRIKEAKDISIHESLSKELSKYRWKVSEDFRTWKKINDIFNFTRPQAEALKVYAESYVVNGIESLHEKTVRDKCRDNPTGSGTLKDLFASREKYFDWKKFIQPEGLGFYRLKIPPE